MYKQSQLLQVAFEWYVASYYLTRRQREIGRHFSLGKIEGVHYDFMWEDRHRQADNFFILKEEPETAVQAIRKFGPADNHNIYVIANQPGLSLAYMSQDCQVMTPAGTLMFRNLEDIPPVKNDVALFQPDSPGDALYLNLIDGADLTMAQDLADQRLHFFVAKDGQQPVAMARLARRFPGTGWVSHVYTAPEARGKGIASAIMGAVLAEQQRAGDTLSLLLAAPEAHNLYRRLGYQDIATVLNFVLA